MILPCLYALLLHVGITDDHKFVESTIEGLAAKKIEYEWSQAFLRGAYDSSHLQTYHRYHDIIEFQSTFSYIHVRHANRMQLL